MEDIPDKGLRLSKTKSADGHGHRGTRELTHLCILTLAWASVCESGHAVVGC
jgi:hypothetical protein